MATLMTHKHTHTRAMHAHTHTQMHKQTNRRIHVAYLSMCMCVCVCIVCVLLSLCLSSFAFAIVFVSIFLCLLLPLLLLARNDFANCQLLFMCRTLLNEFKRGKLPANQPSRLPTTNPMPAARQTPNNTLAHTQTHTHLHSLWHSARSHWAFKLFGPFVNTRQAHKRPIRWHFSAWLQIENFINSHFCFLLSHTFCIYINCVYIYIYISSAARFNH